MLKLSYFFQTLNIYIPINDWFKQECLFRKAKIPFLIIEKKSAELIHSVYVTISYAFNTCFLAKKKKKKKEQWKKLKRKKNEKKQTQQKKISWFSCMWRCGLFAWVQRDKHSNMINISNKRRQKRARFWGKHKKRTC